MAKKCKRRRAMAEMNVVPYIDVMLVLLVIFMVTAPMLQTGVQIDLPDVQAKAIKNDQETPIIISVNKNGDYFNTEGIQIDITELSEYLASQLKNKLSTEQKTRSVYIRADQSVAYRYLMQAMVAAQKAGAKNISLIADPQISSKN